MTLEEKIQFYLDRQPRHTRWISLILNQSMVGGIPIGQGACKGVKLSANHFKLYDTTGQFTAASAKFYYGDSEQQSKEYLINTNETATDTNQRDSGYIPCTDLSEVWVRFADAFVITEAQSRVVEIHVSNTGTDPNTIVLGGIAADISAAATDATHVNIGGSINQFTTHIAEWGNFAPNNLALSGAESIAVTGAGVITITYPVGAAANALVNSSSDPAIAFVTIQEGVDEVLGSIQIEIEIFE